MAVPRRQNADTFLLFLFRKSFALQLFPAVRVLQLTDGALDALGSEFTIQITLGYLLVMAVCLPMSFLNLSENVQFQNVSFAITIVVLTELVAYFVAIPNEVPAPHRSDAPQRQLTLLCCHRGRGSARWEIATCS